MSFLLKKADFKMDFLKCNDWIEFKAKQAFLFLVYRLIFF